MLATNPMTTATAIDASASAPPAEPTGPALRVLGALSASHMVNDMMQSLLLAIYPVLKGTFALSFAQIGLITLTYQLTASLFQPLVGLYTDRRPVRYALPIGMCSTSCGLVLLAFAPSFHVVMIAASLIGLGSAVFHPESSRIARFASGGRHGFAQSLFQVGGNTGTAFGPLLAAAFIVPYGQHSVAWFALAALCGVLLLTLVSRWYARQHAGSVRKAVAAPAPAYPRSTSISPASARSTCSI